MTSKGLRPGFAAVNWIFPLALLGFFPGSALADCPPAGFTKTALMALRADGFTVEDDAERNQLAVDLLACVGNPDPELRDGVAFEGLSSWLRGQLLTSATIDNLYDGLVSQLRGPADETGFLRPFAALILSEVARSDRVEPAFSEDRRAELVDVTSEYLAGVRDYRGYSDSEGWRHGVAHASDLALQLVLNENIDESQVKSLLDAVASQVAPAGDVFYVYSEPMRLARPVIYAWRRGIADDEYWKNWFENLTEPAPLESWRDAFSSNAGLARRHNMLAFLMAMHLNAKALPEGQGEPLAEIVMDALRRVL